MDSLTAACGSKRKPLVCLRNVEKSYSNGEITQSVLSQIEMQIDAGEYVALIGQSGSGKSTLMNIVGFLDKASSGKYFFDDVDIYANYDQEHLSKLRLNKIGFIFQNYSLFPKLTALENVITPLIYKEIPRKKRKHMGLEALDKVGLADKANHLPNQLSGGQQQRVAIARALVKQPELILADEPTGNLDSKNSEIVLSLFEQLHADGNTLIVITHESEVAQKSARTITINDGRITTNDQPLS